MRNKIFISTLLIITIVVTISIAGCTQNLPNEMDKKKAENAGENELKKERPNALVIASGNTAGTYYYIASGQAKILSEKIEGLTVNNEATNGTVNYDYASQSIDTIGMGGLEQFVSAIGGVEERGYPVALDNIKLIQSGHKFILYGVALADSGIETFFDLNGKKIGRPSLTGSSTPLIDAIYEAYGIDTKTLKETPGTHTENLDALRDGVIDFAFVAGGVPMAGITDLVTSKNINLLSIDKEIVEPIIEKAGYFDIKTIEPGTYNKQTEPVNLLTVDVVIAANENLDDELVYEITKALNENTDELALVHKDGAEWNLENSLKLYKKNIVPFHTGAARYYDEFK